ncbi:hypothetical protein Tco_1272756 [Tanacetum coccineum]|uniref:Uncharacterized protein n=1 Tax=Tanacetum coccineum TaxID=301880 RepID=A0ABQ5D905_9ASTR
MTTLTRAPRPNVVPTAKKTDSSHQELEFLFSPLIEEYYTSVHGHAEDNNNDQAPNASFQEAEFINPFCTWVQEIDMITDGPESSIRTSLWKSNQCQFKQDDSLPQILKCDELHQFDRLKVWELAKGFMLKEEGIDLEDHLHPFARFEAVRFSMPN